MAPRLGVVALLTCSFRPAAGAAYRPGNRVRHAGCPSARGSGADLKALRLRLGGPVLIGRGPEQAAVRDAVDDAADGAGGVLFLVGEAGIGKTRLAAEAVRSAGAAGHRVLRGRAASSTAQYRALREAFMPVLRRTGPPDDPGLRPYHAALARLLPEWRPDHPAPEPAGWRPSPAGPDDAPVVLAEGVLRLLVALAEDGHRDGGDGDDRTRSPACVVVLEDLHDADADTLAVIDYLVDHLGEEPVLVIATVRPGSNPGMGLVRAATRRRAATVLELGPLDHVLNWGRSTTARSANSPPNAWRFRPEACQPRL
ncbi:ATP-binding protein [Actinoplanes sp. NEAU-A12]|uniref:ATP-binding protein n=1 Tax=Actinoplanes sandaracinus TaxID=3045177 RepID=A0ABT6WKS0_9ACTN|nr:ATP-binding protein [Actinoplanes sandaracinus]MDI6100335.1 ATP-binding protein [Actinoplanes sandaracinus]